MNVLFVLQLGWWAHSRGQVLEWKRTSNVPRAIFSRYTKHRRVHKVAGIDLLPGDSPPNMQIFRGLPNADQWGGCKVFRDAALRSASKLMSYNGCIALDASRSLPWRCVFWLQWIPNVNEWSPNMYQENFELKVHPRLKWASFSSVSWEILHMTKIKVGRFEGFLVL